MIHIQQLCPSSSVVPIEYADELPTHISNVPRFQGASSATWIDGAIAMILIFVAHLRSPL
jgi:hypothetical protein